jgi:hypothetical protein
MRRHIALLWAAAFFGLLTAANAQAPPPSTARAAFDGTYTLVSVTKLNDTWTGGDGHVRPCPDYKRGPLTIVSGQVRDSYFTGAVGPQGKLTMRHEEPGRFGYFVHITVTGSIDTNGTIRARRMGYTCSYDVILQKKTR